MWSNFVLQGKKGGLIRRYLSYFNTNAFAKDFVWEGYCNMTFDCLKFKLTRTNGMDLPVILI